MIAVVLDDGNKVLKLFNIFGQKKTKEITCRMSEKQDFIELRANVTSNCVYGLNQNQITIIFTIIFRLVVHGVRVFFVLNMFH